MLSLLPNWVSELNPLEKPDALNSVRGCLFNVRLLGVEQRDANYNEQSYERF